MMEGGVGFADGVGEKKIKKRAAGPTQGRAEKKGGPGHGASLHQGAASHGTWGHSAGYLVLYRLHSVAHTVHTRTRAAATSKRYDTELQQFSCSVRESERGEGGREDKPPPRLSPT